ncbi:MAG: HAD family phosphatase [Candidatus Rokubacteria bacterium]|nr:HAD family phosphatase [Candidatus Rokubacteria bacterium]
MRFAAVVFDMDGVLVDSEPLHVDAMREVLRPYGVPYTDRENEEFFGFTDPEVFRVLRARYGLAADEEELTRRRAALVVELTRTRSVPMAGVPEVPTALRALGYRLAVASSSALDVIRATIDTLGIAALFETLVSGLDAGRGKPAPDVFLETSRRLGLPPGACLAVEDSRNGLLAAKAAGMACAVIPCAATRHEDFAEADWRLAGLPELLAILDSSRSGRAR